MIVKYYSINAGLRGFMRFEMAMGILRWSLRTTLVGESSKDQFSWTLAVQLDFPKGALFPNTFQTTNFLRFSQSADAFTAFVFQPISKLIEPCLICNSNDGHFRELFHRVIAPQLFLVLSHHLTPFHMHAFRSSFDLDINHASRLQSLRPSSEGGGKMGAKCSQVVAVDRQRERGKILS